MVGDATLKRFNWVWSIYQAHEPLLLQVKNSFFFNPALLAQPPLPLQGGARAGSRGGASGCAGRGRQLLLEPLRVKGSA